MLRSGWLSYYVFVYLFDLTTLMPGLIHSLTDWPIQSYRLHANTSFQAYDKNKGKVPVCLLCHFRVNNIIKDEAMSMKVQQGESYCFQVVVLRVGWTSAILAESNLFIVHAHAWNLKTLEIKLRARSFGIFRNKNIFWNKFWLFCAWNSRNGNPGIPKWE